METAPTPSPCVSGYRCVYFPDHVDSDCLLKTGTIWSSWAIFLPPPPVMQLAPQSVPIQVKNSSEGGEAGWWGWAVIGTWGQTGGGGSQQNGVEFYTLHLQQWRHRIWHTTPIPAGAIKAAHRAVEFYTQAFLTPLLMFQPGWFGRNWRHKEKKKVWHGAEIYWHHSFVACHVDVDHLRIFSAELQLYLKVQSVRISSV